MSLSRTHVALSQSHILVRGPCAFASKVKSMIIEVSANLQEKDIAHRKL